MGCGNSKKENTTSPATVKATDDKYKKEEDEESLLADQEEQEQTIIRTKAMERLANVALNQVEVPNIEEELFVWGDFKVDIMDVARQRAEKLARVRRPQQQVAKKKETNSKKEGIRAGSALGDEDMFSWGDFKVNTQEEEVVTYVPVVQPDFHTIHNFQIRTLIGHASRVKCIAMTPQERHFVSCSNEDTSVTMQDSRTGKETTAFLGHEDTIISAAFSSDYKFLATTSRDNTMILWDVVTAKQVLTFEHEKVVICCAFSRDSKFLVSGCQDKICRIWDTRKGREILSFSQHEGIIIAVAHSPTEDLICSASADKTLRIWTTKGENKHVLTGHVGIVLTCAFSSSGKNVVSNDEKTVKVWKVETGECVMTANVENYMNMKNSGVKKLTWTLCAYCPGRFGHFIVLASNTRVVMVLDPDNGEEVLSMMCKAPVYCLSAGLESEMAFGDSFGNIYIMTLM
jgi:hypothetical protein